MKRLTLVEIIAVLLEILFLYAGIIKLLDYDLFKEQIASSPMLEPVAGLIAWGLPKIEIIIAIMLFIPRLRLIGLYTSFVLMGIFTGYIIAILIFSKHIPCSCGGIIELLSWRGHLIFNGIYAGLALTGILIERQIKNKNHFKLSSLEQLHS